ncbi:MAG TPA: hypothetical protein VD737_00645, partial [Steroidobacteraceae bacterium]|nr:hypothetical protein [Steroidobacteraceae bacterium]
SENQDERHAANDHEAPTQCRRQVGAPGRILLGGGAPGIRRSHAERESAVCPHGLLRCSVV